MNTRSDTRECKININNIFSNNLRNYREFTFGCIPDLIRSNSHEMLKYSPQIYPIVSSTFLFGCSYTFKTNSKSLIALTSNIKVKSIAKLCCFATLFYTVPVIDEGIKKVMNGSNCGTFS